MKRTAEDVKAKVVGLWGRLRQNVDLLMLAAVALIVVSGWLLIELADEVLEGDAQRYDEWVLRQFRSAEDPSRPIGPAWFEAAWRDVTALGSATVLTLATLACAGYLLIGRRYRTLVALAVVVVGGIVLTFAMKALFARPRPEYAAGMKDVISASFPSGHSMLSAVVYLTLGALFARTTGVLRYKMYFVGLGLVVTLLVGISRIYLGVHYPTDVLAGWSAGLTWALLCWLVVCFLQSRRVIERPNAAGAIDSGV
ncbi:MAG: phosphatase PAP2 family protein [Phycisphaerae bacterium]|nr:phosphatase PAP2 family protein [Phycisphaerae bacterium]